MKKAIRFIFGTARWLFIILLIYLGSLFFREERLPESWVDAAISRISAGDLVIKVDSVSFGFRRGFVIGGVKIYDKTRKDSLEPMASARSVSIDPLQRLVRVVGAKYKRLPDSYYAPGYSEIEDEGLDMDLPKLPDFRLKLERPEILGLTPERVTALVTCRKRLLAADEVHIFWPEGGRHLTLDGFVRIDLNEQTLVAEVRGQATQSQIRPLLVALDLPCSYPYFDGFTGITEPIPAAGRFDVDLRKGDFGMRLNLKPVMGAFNGAEMANAEGTLDVRTAIRGTNCNVRLGVELPVAVDRNGGRLAGKFGLGMTNDVIRLDYDVSSSLKFADLLKIIDVDFLSEDTLDMIKCNTPPRLTAKGRNGTSTEDAGWNDAEYTVFLRKGSLYGFELNDTRADFTFKKDVLHFPAISSRGKTGGKVDADVTLAFPGFDETKANIKFKVDYAKGSLEELADFFDFDLGERRGTVDGRVELSGMMNKDIARTLNGKGSVKISEGRLAQMKLFAGLTELLAEKVPGVGFLVNQSVASTDFTIENGIFKSDNVFIEGGLVSIKGWGTYDIAADNLDFTVRVQFLKKDTMLATLVHPVTWPFTKLLLEFKAHGPIDDPAWDYISIIDRIL
ncbi:MAG: hypothetical protein J6W80_02145 [Kiritimatiellae bacterium]|nr:hypothetical protein [Kiritimatiellia bacterium]